MTILYSIFFGAGVAAIVYSRFARRIGYGNTQNVWTVVGLVFLMTTIIFFIILSMLQS